MDTISIRDVDHYFWLGRYGERVFTTALDFFKTFDYIIEHEDAYWKFCLEMEIPEIYGSNEKFIDKYLFDEEDENSVISNLNRAYDNAIIFRNVIKSESLAYIDMAILAMQRARDSKAPIIELQKVLDNIRAFWSCIDEKMETDEERDIIFIGRYFEQLDLYLRRNYDYHDVHRSYRKLAHRLERCSIWYDRELFDRLGEEIEADGEYTVTMALKLEKIFESSEVEQ